MYEDKCYIGLILELDDGNKDAHINFMHPHWPSQTFFWPEHKNTGREDKCWVPFTDIICSIDIPELSSQVGRMMFSLSKKSDKNINAAWPRKD